MSVISPLTQNTTLAADPGFSFMDDYALGMLFLGLALFAAVAALSQQEERPFSPAAVYLLLGAVVSAGLELLGLDLIEPFADTEVIERLAEFAVIVALFSAGLKLDRPLGWRGWRSTMVLLVVVMPVTIGAVALFATQFIGLSLGAAIILGAVLAPTDPVLASDVGVGPPGTDEEPEPQFALTSEAGFNDGLAFPFVFLGIFIAGQGGTSWLVEWITADVIYAIPAGLAIGGVAGRLLAMLVSHLRGRGLLVPELDAWLAIAAVLGVYGLTEVVGAYGFLAAFAGGLGFRRYERDHEYNERAHSGAQTVENFSELALVLLLGSTVTLTGLAEPGVAGWLLVPFLLLLVRPLATLAATAGSRMPLAQRAFIGWFGIRGIGSFYYVAVAIGSGAMSFAEAQVVYWTVVVCVGISILLHGVTATPATRYIRQ